MDTSDDLALYCYATCYYCIRVRRAVARLGISLPERDILATPEHRRELIAATGRTRVPVLRIEQPDGEVRWLPESMDIVAYLEQRFGQDDAKQA